MRSIHKDLIKKLGMRSRMVLMSIKPVYADRILSGEKKFEFRRQCFGEDVKRVEIYSSYPVQRIVGYFTVKAIYRDTPEKIWDLCKEFAGIDLTSYTAYFNNRNIAYSIAIGAVRAYPVPRLLSEYHARPPQSYCYIC